MSVPTAVCFDLDGCLVDSRVPIAAAMNHALTSVGAPSRDEQDLHARIGPPLLGALEQMLVESGHDPARGHDAVGAYREVYGELALVHTVAIPGMAQLLASLQDAGVVLLVVTGKPAEFASPILQAVGMQDRFAGVFAPSLDALAEPKATTLARALAHAGMSERSGVERRSERSGVERRSERSAVEHRGVVMVGDRHHDVDAGRACGTRTVGVTWGSGSREELVAAGADVIVERPAELHAVLGLPGRT